MSKFENIRYFKSIVERTISVTIPDTSDKAKFSKVAILEPPNQSKRV